MEAESLFCAFGVTVNPLEMRRSLAIFVAWRILRVTRHFVPAGN
jgi:hypothetical protein